MNYYMNRKSKTESYLSKTLITAIQIIQRVGWDNGYHLEPKQRADEKTEYNEWLNGYENRLGKTKVGIYEAITMIPELEPVHERTIVAETKYHPYLNETAICAVIQRINDFEMPIEKTALDRKIFLQRWNRNINPEKGEWLALEALREASEQSNLAEIFCQLIEEAERRGEI